MGYDLHIIRSKDWADSDEQPITLDEWLALIRDDPEMRVDGFAEAATPEGETVRVESRGLAVWTAYSGNELRGNMAWFDHWRGTIVVKNPDDEIIDKMKRLANKLSARVVRDEGEEY